MVRLVLVGDIGDLMSQSVYLPLFLLFFQSGSGLAWHNLNVETKYANRIQSLSAV